MYRIVLLLSLLLALLNACGESSSATVASTDTPSADVAAASSDYDLSCMLEEGRSICDFLDPEVVFQFLPREAEQTKYRDLKRGSMASCGYAYPTGKNYTVRVVGQNITAGHDMSIGIFGVKQSRSSDPLAGFKATYRSMGEEEVAAKKKQMQDDIQKKIDAGELDKTAGELAGGFTNQIRTTKYEPVEGLGTAATWDISEDERKVPTIGTLYVLAGDVIFGITADMTTSKEDSKQAAIAVARAVLASCD